MHINLFISKRFFDRYQILFLEFRLESNKKIEDNKKKKKLLFNSGNSCYKQNKVFTCKRVMAREYRQAKTAENIKH